MTAIEARKQIQTVLHTQQDGVIGPATMKCLQLLIALPDNAPWPPGEAAIPNAVTGFHEVDASSFADPADVRAFHQCKASGGSDLYCFGRGDNGLGFGKYDCTQGSGPACALPPEDWLAKWGSHEDAELKKVRVRINGREIVCELRDTMPHKANIHNGAGIDLNPDAVAALGLQPPIMIAAEWQWV